MLNNKGNKILTLQSYSGFGPIHSEREKVAEAFYNLRVEQEFFVSPIEEIPGLKTTTGYLFVVQSEHDLADGSILTLSLEDGQRWRFLALPRNPDSSFYKAVPARLSDSLSAGKINLQPPEKSFTVSGTEPSIDRRRFEAFQPSSAEF